MSPSRELLALLALLACTTLFFVGVFPVQSESRRFGSGRVHLLLKTVRNRIGTHATTGGDPPIFELPNQYADKVENGFTCFDKDRLKKVLELLEKPKEWDHGVAILGRYYASHGYRHHFAAHALPYNDKGELLPVGSKLSLDEYAPYRVPDCFALDDKEYDGDDIKIDSIQFRTGCAAFKSKALTMKKLEQAFKFEIKKFGFYASLAPSFSKWKDTYFFESKRSLMKDSWVKTEVDNVCKNAMKELNLDIEDSCSFTFEYLIKLVADKNFKECDEMAKMYKLKSCDDLKPMIEKFKSIESKLRQIKRNGPPKEEVDKQEVNPLITKSWDKLKSQEAFEALLCLPLLYAGAGMVDNGLSRHPMFWYGKSIHPSHLEYRVPISSTCARLTTNLLLQFSKFRYVNSEEAKSEFIRSVFGSGTWNDVCVATDKGNCRTYSDCWLRAVQMVCKLEPKCCPSEEIAKACKQDSAYYCKGIYTAQSIFAFSTPIFAQCSDCKDADDFS